MKNKYVIILGLVLIAVLYGGYSMTIVEKPGDLCPGCSVGMTYSFPEKFTNRLTFDSTLKTINPTDSNMGIKDSAGKRLWFPMPIYPLECAVGGGAFYHTFVNHYEIEIGETTASLKDISTGQVYSTMSVSNTVPPYNLELWVQKQKTYLAYCGTTDTFTHDGSYNIENILSFDTVVTDPTIPLPKGLTNLISDMLEWIKQVFKSVFSLSITGASEVLPGAIEEYSIDLSAEMPDTDYSDGTFSTQYGYWALIDKDGSIITGQTKGIIVYGEYSTVASVTIPLSVDNHVILGTITQIDSSYDFGNGVWVDGEEYIVTKEAISLSSKLPIPVTPISGGFQTMLTNLFDWIKGLFSWLI